MLPPLQPPHRKVRGWVVCIVFYSWEFLTDQIAQFNVSSQIKACWRAYFQHCIRPKKSQPLILHLHHRPRRQNHQPPVWPTIVRVLVRPLKLPWRTTCRKRSILTRHTRPTRHTRHQNIPSSRPETAATADLVYHPLAVSAEQEDLPVTFMPKDKLGRGRK